MWFESLVAAFLNARRSPLLAHLVHWFMNPIYDEVYGVGSLNAPKND